MALAASSTTQRRGHVKLSAFSSSVRMASSSSSEASSSSTQSGSRNKTHKSDKIPSTALLAHADKDQDLTSSNEVDTEDDLNNICSSLSSAWVDDIRFVSYRLAAKLRLLQQRTGLVLLDVWNVIEAFRENGLANAENETTLSKVPFINHVDNIEGTFEILWG